MAKVKVMIPKGTVINLNGIPCTVDYDTFVDMEAGNVPLAFSTSQSLHDLVGGPDEVWVNRPPNPAVENHVDAALAPIAALEAMAKKIAANESKIKVIEAKIADADFKSSVVEYGKAIDKYLDEVRRGMDDQIIKDRKAQIAEMEEYNRAIVDKINDDAKKSAAMVNKAVDSVNIPAITYGFTRHGDVVVIFRQDRWQHANGMTTPITTVKIKDLPEMTAGFSNQQAILKEICDKALNDLARPDTPMPFEWPTAPTFVEPPDIDPPTFNLDKMTDQDIADLCEKVEPVRQSVDWDAVAEKPVYKMTLEVSVHSHSVWPIPTVLRAIDAVTRNNDFRKGSMKPGVVYSERVAPLGEIVTVTLDIDNARVPNSKT